MELSKESAASMAETHRRATSFSPSERGRSSSSPWTATRSAPSVDCSWAQPQSSPAWGKATMSSAAFQHWPQAFTAWSSSWAKSIPGCWTAAPATSRSSPAGASSASDRRTKAIASSSRWRRSRWEGAVEKRSSSWSSP